MRYRERQGIAEEWGRERITKGVRKSQKEDPKGDGMIGIVKDSDAIPITITSHNSPSSCRYVCVSLRAGLLSQSVIRLDKS